MAEELKRLNAAKAATEVVVNEISYETGKIPYELGKDNKSVAKARKEYLRAKSRVAQLKNRQDWDSIVEVDKNAQYQETRETAGLKMKIKLAETKYALAKKQVADWKIRHPNNHQGNYNVSVENSYIESMTNTYNALIKHKATEKSRIEEAVAAI